MEQTCQKIMAFCPELRQNPCPKMLLSQGPVNSEALESDGGLKNPPISSLQSLIRHSSFHTSLFRNTCSMATPSGHGPGVHPPGLLIWHETGPVVPRTGTGVPPCPASTGQAPDCSQSCQSYCTDMERHYVNTLLDTACSSCSGVKWLTFIFVFE